MTSRENHLSNIVARLALALFTALMLTGTSLIPSLRTEAGSGNMEITPIDFGPATWGDATLLTSGGKTLLMDTCNTDRNNTIINYLNDHHFYTFDIYISHYHFDHMFQVVPILNDSRFNVSKIYLPDPAYLKTAYKKNPSYAKIFYSGWQSIVSAANKQGVQIIYLKKGSTFTVGNATLQVVWGCNYKSSVYDTHYINNNSLVTRVPSGDTVYLTCGDIEKAVEKQILSAGVNITADIFKFSHHGGSTSNSAGFVQKVNPSFSYFNWNGDTPTSFGNGWPATPIKNLKDISNIYSSRYNGMLNFSVKAGHISVAGERNMRSVTVDIKNSAGAVVNRVTYQFNNALDYHITPRMMATAASVSAENATTALPKRYVFTPKFIQDAGGYKYRNTNGSFTQNKFQSIGGEMYYFDANGYRVTGFRTINNKTYYFDAYGRMLLRWKRINGKKYFFDPVDGYMHTGWEWVEEKGAWYYLSPSTGYLVEGWQTIDGRKYYFAPGDFYAKTGFQTISKKKYCFDTRNAYMLTGWQTIGGYTYYFGTDGVMVTGTRTIGGRTYKFNSKGRLIQGTAPKTSQASAASNGNKIIWNSTPYLTTSVTKKWAKGTSGVMPVDYKTKRNTAFVNDMLSYATYFKGKVKYGSSSNKTDPKNKRWKTLTSGGVSDCSWFVYHVLNKYGLVEDFVHSHEWGNKPSCYPGGQNIGTDVSKASPGDILCTGKGTKSSNSHVAIYLGNGRQVECAAGKGVVVTNAPSTVRDIIHFKCLPKNNSASFSKASVGSWVKSGSSYKYKVGSSYLTNCFQNINGSIYYFNSAGKRVTGWKTIEGKKYYFQSNGQMLLRWKRINGKKYYFDPITGYMHTGWEWVAENKKWYYLSPSKGYLLEGWKTINGKKYYLTPGEYYAKTGWQTIGGKKYYFASDGHMLTGKQKIGGKTYTFGSHRVLKN